MSDGRRAVTFLEMAEESLAGAVSEHANGRFRNCANRAYYATFQAAIAALIRIGVGPSAHDRRWHHDAVQAQFAEQLIKRRKLYPASMRDTLARGAILRVRADYTIDQVSVTEAIRLVRRSQEFVEAVRRHGGESP